MADASELKRVAFSPGEFAKLFGKSQTWGYRQIYAGKVRAITEYGRTFIPAAEVEAILKTAGVYDGLKSKPTKTKQVIQSLGPCLGDTWQNFLTARRQSASRAVKVSVTHMLKAKWPSSPTGREAAIARLAKKPKTS